MCRLKGYTPRQNRRGEVFHFDLERVALAESLRSAQKEPLRARSTKVLLVDKDLRPEAIALHVERSYLKAFVLIADAGNRQKPAIVT